MNEALENIMRELDDILGAEDEPDFRHSASESAYETACGLITAAYASGVLAVPEPAAAPDGDGGVRIEWQRQRLTVRLVVSDGGEGYVYSRAGESAVDKPATADALARRLRSVFAGHSAGKSG